MAYSIRLINLKHYLPSVSIIVPLYERLAINRAKGFVEILVHCRIGQSSIFGVILSLIKPFFITLPLQVRERLYHIIGRPQIRTVDGVFVDGVINGRIWLNYDYPHRSTPMSMLRISRDVRDAWKKDNCREYAHN